MGSQTGQAQIDKIESYIQVAKEEGQNIVTGGERITDNGLDKGYFFQPTIIEINSNDSRLAQEEIFGPVLVVQKFSDVEEVIKLANDSEYGLGGGVFTKDINRALNIANRIDTGRVWINTYNQIPAGSPFGGYKNQVSVVRHTERQSVTISRSKAFILI